MPAERDIPGRIALWLFRIGIIWAVVFAPLTIIGLASFFGIERDFWRLEIYFLFGFAVWLGWRWRSRERRALKAAAAFWLFSAVFNSVWLAYFAATVPEWPMILIYDEQAFMLWWWIAATLASLVAFRFEFTLPRDEKRKT